MKFHIFGSPTYVLELTLQSGNKIPWWNSHSKLGIYLGKSSEHAGNVSLILDLITNYVSPQFHTVYDDNFTSVLRQRVNILPPDWNKLFKHNNKITDDILINTSLTATISNEEDNVLKVTVKFDEEMIIRLNASNKKESNSENESISDKSLDDVLISVNPNDESLATFNNEYNESESSNENTSPVPESIRTTRTG